jgi:hypothetical protein
MRPQPSTWIVIEGGRNREGEVPGILADNSEQAADYEFEDSKWRRISSYLWGAYYVAEIQMYLRTERGLWPGSVGGDLSKRV